MTLSLAKKILGSFALVIFISIVISVAINSYFMRIFYYQYVIRRDFARANMLSRVLGERKDFESEEFEDECRPNPSLKMLEAQFGLRRPEGGGRRSRLGSGRQIMMGGGYHSMDQIVITDLSGRVIINNSDYDEEWIEPEHRGIPIEMEEWGEGYLYLGGMIPNLREMNFPPEEMKISIWLAAVFIFSLSLGLGILLTRTIVRPVSALKRAAGRVAAGDLSVRVNENRTDELGVLAQSFNSMTASLERSDRQKRQHVADSAHELRTPVSLIRARIEMIEAGIYPFNARELAHLSEESLRLTRLIDELKELSDLESSQYNLNMEQINMRELLESVVESIRPFTEKRELALICDISDNLSELEGDRSKLHQLFANLLANAWNHAKSRILIRAELAGNSSICVSIEDDGPGIPQDKREIVFERYYRLDTARMRWREGGGMGLGLAICREIVHLHKGRIEALSSLRLGGASLSIRF